MMNKHSHTKHAKLPRTSAGEWGRNELAILGAPCKEIRALADHIIQALVGTWNIAFADAGHPDEKNRADEGALPEYLRLQNTTQLTISGEPDTFARRTLLNAQDLILVNGNHFTAQQQLIIIDDAKPLQQKIDRLSDVVLIVMKDSATTTPGYIQDALPGFSNIPILQMAQPQAIAAFIDQYLKSRIAPLNGLVLAGGQSLRMGQDKSLLDYHGNPQRERVYNMLETYCCKVFVSCNNAQNVPAYLNPLPDAFLGLGPMGGILTAMQSAPANAWLAIACDLPYLNTATLQCLMEHRNPAKFATAFYNDALGFPEPMIAIWEPRAYPMLLQLLAQGYSCPRKALINSDIELVRLPDASALQNINDPEAFNAAIKELRPQF